MKALREPKNLIFLVLGAGVLGLLLRAALYALGADDRGLISNYHPLQVICLLLAAATAVYVGITTKQDGSSNTREDHSPRNRNMVIFVILVPIWFLANAFTALDLADDRFDTIRAVLAFAAVPCFAWTLFCHFRGKNTPFVLHGVICLFFAMDMICRYRVWSGNPQLVDYGFQLFACVFLTLTAYYRTAFDVELGSRRMFRFCSLMAMLFCCFSLAGPDDVKFYISSLLWAMYGIALRPSGETAENAEEV